MLEPDSNDKFKLLLSAQRNVADDAVILGSGGSYVDLARFKFYCISSLLLGLFGSSLLEALGVTA